MDHSSREGGIEMQVEGEGGAEADHSPREGGIERKGPWRERRGRVSQRDGGREWSPHTRARARAP
jgi:hypothetical protein